MTGLDFTNWAPNEPNNLDGCCESDADCLQARPCSFIQIFFLEFFLVLSKKNLGQLWLIFGKCDLLQNLDKVSHQYLTNVQCCYRRFGHETIYPTQKFTSMNMSQIPCVITYRLLLKIGDWAKMFKSL